MIASYSGSTHGGDINELYELLQNLHPKIKLTMEHSLKELLFLDILIKNVNGQIITDIYHKPTEPNNTSTSEATTPKTV